MIIIPDNYTITGNELVELMCHDGTVEVHRIDDIKDITSMMEDTYIAADIIQSVTTLKVRFKNGRLKEYSTMRINISGNLSPEIDRAALTALLCEDNI